jgi:hypothetical protein
MVATGRWEIHREAKGDPCKQTDSITHFHEAWELRKQFIFISFILEFIALPKIMACLINFLLFFKLAVVIQVFFDGVVMFIF